MNWKKEKEISDKLISELDKDTKKLEEDLKKKEQELENFLKNLKKHLTNHAFLVYYNYNICFFILNIFIYKEEALYIKYIIILRIIIKIRFLYFILNYMYLYLFI